MKGSRFDRFIKTLLAVMLSLLVTEFSCSGVSLVLPRLSAPVGLFSLRSEVVALDIYGAFLPLLLCVGLGFEFRHFARLKGRTIPYQGIQFWLSILLVTLFALALFGFVQETSGSMVLSNFEALFVIPFGGLLGVLYAIKRGVEVQSSAVGAETFAIGVLGMFLSDMVRTFSGWSQVPAGSAIVWGGGGLHDLVLWFGVYLAVGAFSYRLLLSRLVH